MKEIRFLVWSELERTKYDPTLIVEIITLSYIQ